MERMVEDARSLLASREFAEETGLVYVGTPGSRNSTTNSGMDDGEVNDVDNSIVGALLQAAVSSLRMESAEDAVLLLASSERIAEDIQLELDASETWGMNIICRQFEPHMKAHLEFRGFVYETTLTALSQYNHVVHYPALVADAEMYRSLIWDFYNQHVKQHIKPFGNVVIDFCVIIDYDAPDPVRVIVIELNPYREYEGNGTDACLFDWNDDRAILEPQSPPASADDMAFRIRQSPIPSVASTLSGDASHLVTFLRQEILGQ